MTSQIFAAIALHAVQNRVRQVGREEKLADVAIDLPGRRVSQAIVRQFVPLAAAPRLEAEQVGLTVPVDPRSSSATGPCDRSSVESWCAWPERSRNFMQPSWINSLL